MVIRDEELLEDGFIMPGETTTDGNIELEY